jgi:hypothetical protein
MGAGNDKVLDIGRRITPPHTPPAPEYPIGPLFLNFNWPFISYFFKVDSLE